MSALVNSVPLKYEVFHVVSQFAVSFRVCATVDMMSIIVQYEILLLHILIYEIIHDVLIMKWDSGFICLSSVVPCYKSYFDFTRSSFKK